MATATETLVLTGTAPTTGSVFSVDKLGADCNNGFGSQFNTTPLQDGLGKPAVLKTIRLWDNGLKWAQLQSAAGTYNFSQLLKWVKACQGAGYDMIYTFGCTPTFIANAANGGSGCSNPTGSSNTCCPPTDVNTDGSGTDATLKAFFTALIQAVGVGVIKYYELGNEWDAKNFFNGTIQQAVRMGQDAAAIIRSLDPNAVILSPSFHGPTAASFFVSYCETVVNGIPGWKNFDVVNVHMRASDTNQAGNKNANVDPTCFFTAYNQTLAALQTLKANKIDLTAYPLWDDEHGYIPGQGGDGYPPVITDSKMLAAYVAVSLLLRASVGLAKDCYYSWTSNNGQESLQNNDSGTAWNTVANLLIGKTIGPSTPATGYSLGNNQFGPPIFTVPINGGQGLWVWDQSQQSATTFSTFKYPSGYTKWQDIFGGSGTLSGGTVQIGCCPLYLS